ncbi:hypothetical protein HFRIS_007901 [Herbaspirillum frisingense GSF30]|uniref:Uncharacterized protein n=1 Tax=Herbaspirillum frisingense GSF30 TaxID=864073 RepID=A0AAI9IFT4_9BURK|nr:hypothetical protein HFRIS_007901 [Herbaspirillum frisingense GSF30]
MPQHIARELAQACQRVGAAPVCTAIFLLQYSPDASRAPIAITPTDQQATSHGIAEVRKMEKGWLPIIPARPWPAPVDAVVIAIDRPASSNTDARHDSCARHSIR